MASAGTFFLQIGKSLCVAVVRACPRVLNLLYLSRTRVMLSSDSGRILIATHGRDWSATERKHHSRSGASVKKP